MIEYNKDIISLAKILRKNMTPWERKLWYEFFKDYPVHIYRQKVIGNYIVDFYCAKAKIVIELDGGGHYYEEQKKKDDERTQYLNSMNLKVIRVCNLDVDKNFYGVCEFIDTEIKKNLKC